jgi:hypothetical protein
LGVSPRAHCRGADRVADGGEKMKFALDIMSAALDAKTRKIREYL